MPVLQHILPFLLLSTAAAAQKPLTREDALTLALERSPRLIPSRADVAAARARLDGARLLFQENPQLTGAAGTRFLPDGNIFEGEVSASQPVDLLTRGPRIDSARAQLDAAQARFEMRQVELAAEVREAFGQALAAEQRVQLAEESFVLAQQSVRTVEERLAAGATSRLELNTARVELGRAARERTVQKQQHSAALAGLRLLLGLPPSEALEVKGPLAPPALELLSPDAMVERALARRPDLRAARQDVAAASAERTLAGRQVAPVPSLGAILARDEGDLVVMGTLGFTLPVFNQNQAAQGQAAAQAEQARAALANLESAARTEVQLAISRSQAASEAALLYAGDVLQALEQNLELATDAYRAGKVSFPELLILRRETLEARRGYIDSLAELNTAQAQLKRAIGSIR
ncbi:MAG: TolC family protein [Myxococcaceae bacterium]|nr:TolC family protein [Myxococcaceae bacterium]MCI0670286.1 TolC family protein [Myxococcaceae bacterium]